MCLRSTTQGGSLVGRLNASSCFGEEFISCSFRATGSVPENASEYHSGYDVEVSGYNPAVRMAEASETATLLPHTEQPLIEGYLSSIDGLCDLVFRRMFPMPSGPHGLIIVAGTTATGKSKIARGLIYKYIKTLVPEMGAPFRRPHLVHCRCAGIKPACS